jgi:hypothetical protein
MSGDDDRHDSDHTPGIVPELTARIAALEGATVVAAGASLSVAGASASVWATLDRVTPPAPSYRPFPT